MPRTSMPGIKQLFIESWETLKNSFGNILVLSILGSIVGIIFTIILLMGVFGVGLISALTTAGGDQAKLLTSLQNFFTPSRLTQIGISFAILILINIAIKTVTELGIIFAISKAKTKPSMGECLNVGFSSIVPVFIMSLVTTLVIFGGTFLFIIPGILMCLFLSFVTYEIVLGKNTWFSAIKGSIQIMSQHLGDVVLRILAYLVVVCVVYYLPVSILESITKSMQSSLGMFSVGILQFVASIVLGFYGIVFSVTTYQHAKKATDTTKSVSMSWIWITSALGWVIAILIGLQLVKLVQSPLVQDKIKAVTAQIQSKTTVAPSQKEKLDAWEAKISPEARVSYDKSQNLFTKMREQSSSPVTVKKLNDENIALLKKALTTDEKNPVLWQSLASAYTWVSTKGTLQDSLDANKKAEELDPSIWSFAYSTGTTLIAMEKYDEAILKLQQVIRAEDNYGMAHVSLGITYKRTGLKDSAKTELQKGIDILTKYNDDGSLDDELLQARKELETVDQAVVKSTATSSTSKPVASCTSYPIREGEFASNKCYAKKDYDDLIYYLNQYNSAASSYNGAVSSMQITCNGSDFFKNQCEDDKRQKDTAQSNIDKYKTTIQGIIAKGK